ncbi:uncharacterized protein KY384_004618 [Bacidia gigantensis]|uniref:uncharacterized protein n=1 Tax=Bacidia gigantensis TaxID=2732470 RepID=UPI001D03FECC|nr:uncharacterized protein KY384_004618 [Bacidia gigantensis]KAG8531260.1 hypothetical protein KY384_004618 [Bacidia gigantensis]
MDSLCFVHGFAGGRHKSWEKDDIFWPGDFLAEDLHNNARILSWGYDGYNSGSVESDAMSLAQLKEQNSARNLLRSIFGVAFMGTPFLNEDQELQNWLRHCEQAYNTKLKVMYFCEIGELDDRQTVASTRTPHGIPNILLEAEHRDTCKYSSRVDENYQKVLKVLREWVEEIRATGHDSSVS